MDQDLGAGHMEAQVALAPLPPGDGAGPHSVFMDTYAASARFHMARYGTTVSQIAAVAAKNHFHSQFNPLAHYRRDMTIEEVLDDRMVASPLTRAMCAPITDGASALVVVSGRALLRFDKRRAVRIRATYVTTGVLHDAGDPDLHVVALAAVRAYEQAGVGPEDVSLAEVHDACAFSEILHSESLGFCPAGEGGRLAAEGASKLGGARPVNVSGGLESRGHPIAATGAAQLYELVTQLRHEAGERQVEAAQIGLGENSGGYYAGEEAVSAVTILSRT